MNFLTKRRPRRVTEIVAMIIVLVALVVLYAALRGCS